MRLSDEQPGLCGLAFRECVEPLRWIQSELRKQFFRVRCVPFRIERLCVTHEFVHAHPPWQVRLLGEIADATQYGDSIGNRIETKYAHASVFSAQQAENMFDQRGLE